MAQLTYKVITPRPDTPLVRHLMIRIQQLTHNAEIAYDSIQRSPKGSGEWRAHMAAYSHFSIAASVEQFRLSQACSIGTRN